jgi:hypothetical protein
VPDTRVVIFKRRRPSLRETTLADLIRRLPELEEKATIYAAEPWEADSRAILHVQDVETGEGDLWVGDLKYFLEVDIARDAAEVCEVWRREDGLATSEEDRFRAVVHYATNDAYLPVREQPPLPAAERNGFSLAVTLMDANQRGGFADVVAPDGSRARLVWDSAPARFEQRAVPPTGDSRSWGLFGVARPLPLTPDEEASLYLEALEDDLRDEWTRWRGQQGA